MVQQGLHKSGLFACFLGLVEPFVCASTRVVSVSILFMGEIKKHFFLFGSPIKHSLSPTLHNTGFLHHNLPLDYSLHETEDFASVEAKIRAVSTAGGSVTIPHKQSVFKVVDHLSDAAKAIGAVNTIYKVHRCWDNQVNKKTQTLTKRMKNEKGEICGENTDWEAMHDLIVKRLVGMKRNPATSTGLVVGAFLSWLTCVPRGSRKLVSD
jgi:pentafunctional AROM polypeptide